MRNVAALFVDERGVYTRMPNVDLWGVTRDARLYAGPHPIVAHPPRARWGRYWAGGPSAKVRRKLGDDDGCFSTALGSLVVWGGVLEHPAYSRAWDLFALPKPDRRGGWRREGLFASCHVEQGHYGHRARKATWLLTRHVERLPDLIWGPSEARRACELMSKRERAATPPEFAELLLNIARSTQ